MMWSSKDLLWFNLMIFNSIHILNRKCWKQFHDNAKRESLKLDPEKRFSMILTVNYLGDETFSKPINQSSVN